MSTKLDWRQSNLPEDVKAALGVFTQEELDTLTICWNVDDGSFAGIGFFVDDRFTKFAEPDKAAAIDVLERRVRIEIGDI